MKKYRVLRPSCTTTVKVTRLYRCVYQQVGGIVLPFLPDTIQADTIQTDTIQADTIQADTIQAAPSSPREDQVLTARNRRY